MEQNANNHQPEASTDERASPSLPHADDAPPAVAAPPDFEPAALRFRSDGWTPERQREFVEALADVGVIRKAAAMVGMTEQSVSRLRRRPEARAFHIACNAAQGIGARRLVSIAYERAIEGSVRSHYYRGELVGEDRIYDNKMLMFLISKLGDALEPAPEAAQVEGAWEEWMQAIETGAPPPLPSAASEESGTADDSDDYTFDGSEVWRDSDERWWTSFPPPPGYDGIEGSSPFGYKRTLTYEEEEVIEADEAAGLERQALRRDVYFGFAQPPLSSPLEAEPSEPSEPAAPRPRLRLTFT